MRIRCDVAQALSRLTTPDAGNSVIGSYLDRHRRCGAKTQDPGRITHGRHNSGPEEAVKGIVEDVKGKAKEVVGTVTGRDASSGRAGPAGQGRSPARRRQEGSRGRGRPRRREGRRGPPEGRAELRALLKGPISARRIGPFVDSTVFVGG